MPESDRPSQPRRGDERARPTRAAQAEEELRRAALEPELPVDDEAAVAADPDAEEILHDTQTLASEPLVESDRRRGSVLAGGDVDAAWDRVDTGEETVGGSTLPTPDRDVVDDLGRAAGVTYAATEPLRPEEKEGARDEARWELDPASAADYAERQRALDAPPHRTPRRPA